MAEAPTQQRVRRRRHRRVHHRAGTRPRRRPRKVASPAAAKPADAAPADGERKVSGAELQPEVGRDGKPSVPLKAGLLVVHLPDSDPEPLQALAESILKHAEAEVEAATGVAWEFALPLPRALDEAGVHREGDFLSKAMTTMAQGMLDLVIVLTDAPLSARDKAMVYGSHSRAARVAVMSVRRLLEGEDADAERSLGDKDVTTNAQALFLHLLGHIIGVVHQWEHGNLMAPFRFEKDRAPPRYSDAQRKVFRRKARKIPDQKVAAAGALMSFVFHIISAFRNPGQVLLPLVRARAFLMPLMMPTMATAALIPTIVLVFTAEIWDVAFHMQDGTAWWFAGVVILAGASYLSLVQDLFFPRKERETLTEHAAVVNTTLWISMLQALTGLFVVIGLFVWGLQSYVFPEALMAKWTGIETATTLDRVRLAVFIATLGTMTAAMGAALDRKVVVRNLALFSDRA